MENRNTHLLPKLTALWAVSESGLGGIFHALQLPFSGLFLGSFAVIIITFIASNSKNKFSSIVQATLIVLLIKAIASPHSPFTAYIAVCFQGFLGALLYSIFKVNMVSSMLFGIIALFESAFQKLLMMTLLFGKNIWIAFQEFFDGLAEQFHLSFVQEAPVFIVSGYFLLYFFGGLIAGVFAYRLPQLLEKESHNIDFENLPINSESIISKKRKKKYRFLSLLLILLFIVGVFVFSGSFHKALYSILRTIAAIALLQFLVRPLFQYLLTRWKNKQKTKLQQPLSEVMDYVSLFRIHAATAFSIAEKESSILKKFRTFLLTWMTISLYHKE